jgi:hypothetical protein
MKVKKDAFDSFSAHQLSRLAINKIQMWRELQTLKRKMSFIWYLFGNNGETKNESLQRAAVTYSDER